MIVQVHGKGVVVTDGLREYAVRKVNKLTNHFSQLNAATVTETIQGKQHRVEVQLSGDGLTLRGEERGEDMYAAIDRVVDKLERQMQKFKGRQRSAQLKGHHGESMSPRTALATPDEVEEEPTTGQIVRVKRFAIKPVSPEEAVSQMEMLDHDFFVFQNADTNEVNVLYRRDDDNYGLLEPEY